VDRRCAVRSRQQARPADRGGRLVPRDGRGHPRPRRTRSRWSARHRRRPGRVAAIRGYPRPVAHVPAGLAAWPRVAGAHRPHPARLGRRRTLRGADARRPRAVRAVPFPSARAGGPRSRRIPVGPRRQRCPAASLGAHARRQAALRPVHFRVETLAVARVLRGIRPGTRGARGTRTGACKGADGNRFHGASGDAPESDGVGGSRHRLAAGEPHRGRAARPQPGRGRTTAVADRRRNPLVPAHRCRVHRGRVVLASRPATGSGQAGIYESGNIAR
jgi:hypothetical protein